MGLLLSILVSCVGVVELLAIYTNVRRAVAQGQQRDNSDLDVVRQAYLNDLNRERNRLRREIARLEGRDDTQDLPKEIFHTITSDIEVPKIIREACSVPQTPRNATDISTVHKLETKTSDISKVPNIIEDSSPIPIKDKHVQHIFPSYIDGARKQKADLNTPDEEHPIVITDTQQHSSNYEEDYHREPSPFPTYDRLAPRNSLCSELVKDSPVSVSEVDEEIYKCTPKTEDILKSKFDDPDYWGKSLRTERRRSKSRSRSRTPEILLHDRLDFEQRSRSKSPNTPAEDRFESNAPVEKEDGITAQVVDQRYWKRSPSPFQKILDIYASSSSLDQEIDEASTSRSSKVTIVELEEEVDPEVLNSVDGINKQKHTNEDNKRQFKNKKRNKRRGHEARPFSSEQRGSISDEGGSVVAVDRNAVDGDERLQLEEVHRAGPSKKPGEPFWVKQK